MLRKRTRSNQKVQQMNHMMPDGISESNLSQKHKTNSFFNAPGLFVGFNPKSSEPDSVRSPTSPLDFRIFSSFGNPFRCPKSQNERHQKSWDCGKVGLSIVDSLNDENKQSGNIIRSCDCKNILFERQMSIGSQILSRDVSSRSNSLPKGVAVFPNTRAKPANIHEGSSDVLFGIGEAPFNPEPCQNMRACSLDSGGYYGSQLTNFGKSKSSFGSSYLVPENGMKPVPREPKFIGRSLELENSSSGKLNSLSQSINSATGISGSVPASEIDLSEYYTCVRTHGPNPKVTHIFGDCILGCHTEEVTDIPKKNEADETATFEASGPSDVPGPLTVDGFLKFCCSCGKKLDGEDIFMYRGEKAFCSCDCRLQEIEFDEEMEKSPTNGSSSEFSNKPNNCLETSNSILFIPT